MPRAGRYSTQKADMPLRNNTLKNVGNALPKYFGGITNTFTYRGLSLSALIDFKLGLNMIAGRNINYMRHGLSKRTLPGRDVGYVIGDGVNPNGEINKTKAAVQPFYESINPLGINEDFVTNAGFWKLRQISLGYDFTKLLPSGFFVKGLKPECRGQQRPDYQEMDRKHGPRRSAGIVG